MNWLKLRRQVKQQQVEQGLAIRSQIRRSRGPRALSAFVAGRIAEHPDDDEAEALRELWYLAHDQIDITRDPDGPREYVPGEVKNKLALLELARNWSDHPDFLPEWSVE